MVVLLPHAADVQVVVEGYTYTTNLHLIPSSLLLGLLLLLSRPMRAVVSMVEGQTPTLSLSLTLPLFLACVAPFFLSHLTLLTPAHLF